MGLDAQDKMVLADIEHKLTQHGPLSEKMADAAIALARQIMQECPSGSSRDQALKYLASAFVYARAAVEYDRGSQ
jgi:hypothetical protein